MLWHFTCLLAAGTVTGSACPPGTTTNQVRLELRVVSQTGVLGTAINSFDTATHPDQTSTTDVLRRFEVQFRLIDLNTVDDSNPVGLAVRSGFDVPR